MEVCVLVYEIPNCQERSEGSLRCLRFRMADVGIITDDSSLIVSPSYEINVTFVMATYPTSCSFIDIIPNNFCICRCSVFRTRGTRTRPLLSSSGMPDISSHPRTSYKTSKYVSLSATSKTRVQCKIK